VWRYNRLHVVKNNGKTRIVTDGRAMFLTLVDRATVDVER